MRRLGDGALRRLARPSVGVVAIVAGSAALLAMGTSRVKEWAVMTDELLYAKLAQHIGETGSPLPVLHGDHVGFLGVVYPILLAPFYGGLDPVAAFDAAHVVNAVLFASTAIPAYLLGRRLVPTGWALAVALLVVAVPWAVNGAFVMSEAAAYPVFLWAVLACHAALAEPSPRRDALAIGGLALAFFTRPQFLFLAAVLPLAALVVAGPRRALERHRLLAGACAAALLVVVPLAALGQADRLLGDYGVTATQGSLLPFGGVEVGGDPSRRGRGRARRRPLPARRRLGVLEPPRQPSVRLRAFAVLTAISLPLLALETGSFDVRFGGGGVIRDRYAFYLAPLLLLATAACLREERLPLPGIAAATVFFAATVALADFEPVAGLWVDSPQSVLNGVIHDESAGLPAGVFVAVCGVLLGAICLGLAWIPRPAAAAAVGLAVFAFCGSTAGYAFERLLTSNTPAGIPVTGQERVKDWVDRAVSGSVGLLPFPVSRDWGYSAVLWWESELWNERVTRNLVTPDGTWTYTPFPSQTIRLDFASGRFAGTEYAPPYVLASGTDSRFGLAGSQAAANLGLVLLAADRPYRALWATRGLEVDGWTRPGKPSILRVYAQPGNPSRTVSGVDQPECALGGDRPGRLPAVGEDGFGDGGDIGARRGGGLRAPRRPRRPHARHRTLGDDQRPPARPGTGFPTRGRRGRLRGRDHPDRKRLLVGFPACPPTTRAAAVSRTVSTPGASPTGSTSGSSGRRSTTTTAPSSRRCDMFFIATADAEGRPQCSYKGGDPGFVRVLDERTIAFPVYDGNGMYLTAGNALSIRTSASCSSTSSVAAGCG